MKVWIVEASETSYGFGEDAVFVVGVYADEVLATKAADEWKKQYKRGFAEIQDHEVQFSVDQEQSQ